MTTELEQEFFKVFGIEPIEYRKNVPCLNFLSSGICNITDERCNPSKCNEYRPDKTSRLWRDFMEVYPEITDRILLKLICKAHCLMFSIQGSSIELLKENILKEFIYWKGDVDKSEIQQLFKEGE